MLRWLAASPEDFLTDGSVRATGALPSAGPDRRLRWHLHGRRPWRRGDHIATVRSDAPASIAGLVTALKDTSRAKPSFERLRVALDDGAQTTVHVARYPLGATAPCVRRLPGLSRLEAWCTQHGVSDALVGGFYVRSERVASAPLVTGLPLGELWIDGVRQPFVPFSPPWGERRACVSVVRGDVRILPRDELPARPAGDLLQAGPLLVRDGRAVNYEDEGFSAGADQFDSDITAGRHPRAALGSDGEWLIALASDGRADDEAGLTLHELAAAMVDAGAREALNLDGGGSTSLVCQGRLRNTPREAPGMTVPGGRAIATALVFAAR